jgi:RHS repeat-associated protein
VHDEGDMPQISAYLYDGGGERVWKLTGGVIQNYMNGQQIYSSGHLDKTLYASPYMVMTEKEYTKHYYIEGERICSKIGSGFQGAQTPPTSTPIDFIAGSAYICSMQLREIVNRNVQCARYDGGIDIDPYLPPAHNDGNEYEILQYFYHSDHLGSASFVTNAEGAVMQHLQYLPYGELFVSQRNSDEFDSRYKFTAKELDNETSYTYFGARYYDSELSGWLSVDPMSDKYPMLSPYAYCANNPIILIDPDGRAWKPTTSDDNPNGYIWVPEEQSYDDNGNLLEGLYHQAIFFTENYTFDENSDYNMGSATAVVYLADGTIVEYDATTRPSDANRYATVPEGIYEAKVGLHNGDYPALRMGDVGTTDFSNNRIELGTENPAYSDGRTYATGINIHKAGIDNFTGVGRDGRPVSAGCILIDIDNWSSFIGHFNNDAQRNNTVSVSISRTYSTPLNFDWTTPVINTQVDNTRVVIPYKR